ncbi:DMT family transporter [Myceligenerans xiligouense]|uniref:Drug/metabolite transporter (DMT)-like permease n=1 Tax=Myceligenerans xiligouense TaxID=253184 RepID=A0A3N4ZGP6_9MICO|nr:DMT family transporter [Myceligenerans xiligouense]RPF20035.1 drug/metabolite transporter (DMT)-like permease [Myceligenerans xiligouense]
MNTALAPEAPDLRPGEPSGSRTRYLVPLAAGVTVVLWASAFIGIRAAGHDYSPGALTLGRIAVGTLALTVLAGVAGKLRVPRGRLLAGVIVWGVLWFGVYNIALNAAERTLDAGTAALLVQLAPILTAVVAGLALGEGFPARLLTGIGIAFTGVAVIAWASSSGTSDVGAVLLGLTAAVLYSAGTLLQKRMLPRVDALTMTWLGCLAGTVAALPFAGTLVTEVVAAPVPATLGVIYLGVFPTAIAFATWGYALSHTTAGRLSATTYAVPPIAVLLSWWLLDEVPAPIVLVGGALCLGGVILATRRPRTR